MAVAAIAVMMVGGLVALGERPAHAAVFSEEARWPVGPAGYVVIKVCIADDSSVDQRQETDTVVHAPTPSLTTVVSHVRTALSASWERYGGVRFVGWMKCGQLPAGERDDYVGVWIHPDAPNSSTVGPAAAKIATAGQRGVNFMPWGKTQFRGGAEDENLDDFPGAKLVADTLGLREYVACIEFSWDTWEFEYSFSCVEQYAIHEFGHMIGFLHEWQHPEKPAGCTPNPGESPVSWSEVASTPTPGKPYTIVNPTYDPDSIMVYGKDCADVDGVRFGSPYLDDVDRQALATVYPVSNDVGVLRAGSSCGRGRPVSITMDDEDTDADSSATGWTGASYVDADRDTHLELCLVNGDFFAPLAGSAPVRQRDYAVLKMGQVCPAGAIEWFARVDNEDKPGSANRNAIDELALPSEQTTEIKVVAGAPPYISNSTDTTLWFCVFLADEPGVATIDEMPVLHAPYGVFAPSDFAFARGTSPTGSIFSDNEDSFNRNRAAGPLCVPLSEECNRTDARIEAFRRIIDFGPDHRFRTARVCCGPPIVSATVAGTEGKDGWFRSDVTIDYHYDLNTDEPFTTKNCTRTTVMVDTAWSSYTCIVSTPGGSASRTVVVKRDTTPPVGSGSLAPAANAAGWNPGPVTATWTCSDPGPVASGIDNVESDHTRTYDKSGVFVTLGVCVDRAGNATEERAADARIDMDPPVISPPTINPVANAAGWHRTPVSVSWTCADPAPATPDTPTSKPIPSGVPAASQASTSTVTVEGTTNASWTCTDRAGNTTVAPSVPVRIDRTVPQTGVAGLPAGWSRSPVSLTLVPDDTLSGVASTWYSVDGVAPIAGTTLTITGDGEHLLRWWSEDVAGNVEPAHETTVRVDGTAPVTTAAGIPSGWQRDPVTVTFAAADALSGVAATYFTVDGGERQTGESVRIVDEGVHRLVWWSVDGVGNVEESRSADVRIDRTPPDVAVDAANRVRLLTRTVTGTAADSVSAIEGVTVRFESVLGPPTVRQATVRCASGGGCTWSVLAPTLPGTYRITATATDAAGNRTTTAPLTSLMI